MVYLEYGNTELSHLKKADKQLGRVIERVGFIKREVTPDIFEAIIYSIVGQQISPKAAKTVCNRLKDRLQWITPASIKDANNELLRSCGISGRKVSYINGIADAVYSGYLDIKRLDDLSDEEVVKRLVVLPGVGVWTAEMILIFSMCRPDIVSFGDLAIRRGMMHVYGLDSLSKEQFMNIRNRYSPYGTVASLYLWEAAKEK